MKAEERKRKGRAPASELEEKRRREIDALEAALARQKKQLEDLKDAQRRAQKAARRAQLNQRKFAIGGLAQIAGVLEADAGFLLGALLTIGDQRERDGTWPGTVFVEYKSRGDQVLAERAAARKGRKQTDDDEEDDTEAKAVAARSQEFLYQEGAS